MYDGVTIQNAASTNDYISSSNGGSVAWLSSGGQMTMHGGTIKDSLIRSTGLSIDGVILVSGNSKFTMLDGVIENTRTTNTSTCYCAGAITTHQHNNTNIEILGGTIQNNVMTVGSSGYGVYGGGICFNGRSGKLKVHNATFKENEVSASGGAIFFGDVYASPTTTELDIQDTTFQGNKAKHGGALYITPCAKATISDCTFTENEVTGNGGAVYAASNAAITVADSSFTKNAANMGGALLLGKSSKVELNRVTITENEAAFAAGALFADAGSELTMRNTSVTDNVGNYAGGLYYNPATINIGENVVMKGNTATDGTTCNLNVPVNDANETVPVTIIEELKESDIGITMEEITYGTDVTSTSAFTTGYTTQNNADTSKHFTCDTTGYATDLDSTNEVYFATAYTLTYETDGGNTIPSELLKESAPTTLPTPTKEGYTFVHWQSNEATPTTYVAGTAFTMPAQDVTMTAQWEKKSSGTAVVYFTSKLADTEYGSAELSSSRNRLNAAVTISTTPDEGYVVDRVTVTYGNGRTASVTDSGRGTYTYKQPGATATVTVTFISETEEDDSDVTLNRDDHMAYMKGYVDGTFGPNRNMTRSEATVMFSRLLTNDTPTHLNTIDFVDVTGDEWFADAVDVMTHFGIITGYVDGTFGGSHPITRAEFAAIACRFDDLAATGKNIFSDVDDDYWAISYINSAVEKGWITGYEDGTFKPNQYITRAEAVALVNRVLDRTEDVAFIQNHLDEMITFTDVEDSYWAYSAILESANSHDYHKVNGEEAWSNLE